MGISKPKVCKCGHSKENHKSKSKLSFASFCRNCQCNSYLNRDMPNKASYFFMILAVSLGMLLIVISFIVYLEANPENTGTQDTMVDMTLGELYGLLSLIFVAAIVFFGMWFVVDPILSVLSERKRKKFPIAD